MRHKNGVNSPRPVDNGSLTRTGGTSKTERDGAKQSRLPRSRRRANQDRTTALLSVKQGDDLSGSIGGRRGQCAGKAKAERTDVTDARDATLLDSGPPANTDPATVTKGHIPLAKRFAVGIKCALAEMREQILKTKLRDRHPSAQPRLARRVGQAVNQPSVEAPRRSRKR